jgi:rhamnogalacturonyl hydrolase YesR
MLYGIRGLLEDLPASHPARPALCRMLAEELEGLLNFQDEQGLWRNVIDAPPAYSRQDSCITWIINDRVWAGLVERVAAG